ncbi:MAG: hypothetical protein CVT92_08970 [Bacteroidetes bacterium HGW-Bacteroidetes-1]|jgi:uncharacterized coiled-coil protein SlyX|nr:MAG: hypothetical protein CVT92_08970 [Bacteroidetes bacterium HGW-Bacteroidetes-1]
MSYRYKRLIPIAILLLIIGGVFLVPIKIPFNFRSVGLLNPAKKWSLRTDQEGNYYSEIKNFHTGATEQSISYRFERGDIASLYLSKKMENNVSVLAEDTIGVLYSRMIEERLQQLESQVAVWNQQLLSYKAGEKKEVIDQLRQKLILSEQQLDLAIKNYERYSLLYQDSVIASNEFDEVENVYKSAKTNVEIANSDYNVATTGVKPEEILLIEEQMTASEKELSFLRETSMKYVLLSPFSGKLIINQYLPVEVEYISIIDTSEYILYTPVKFQYRPYLSYDMKIDFLIPGTDEHIMASIVDITNRVEYIHSNQMIFVKARILNPTTSIMPGLSVNCRLSGDKITLREYIKRTLHIFFL